MAKNGPGARRKKPFFQRLECSMKGYRECSPLYAQVTLFGKTHSIEEWYQKAKGVKGSLVDPDRNPYMMRGITPEYYEVNGRKFGLNFGQRWYNYLWYLYLESNPKIVEYLSDFSEYTDIYRYHYLHVSQAESIYNYMYNYEDFKKDALLVEKLIGITKE